MKKVKREVNVIMPGLDKGVIVKSYGKVHITEVILSQMTCKRMTSNDVVMVKNMLIIGFTYVCNLV